MTEYCWSSQATSGMSNEDSTVLTFQRTISAQVNNAALHEGVHRCGLLLQL